MICRGHTGDRRSMGLAYLVAALASLGCGSTVHPPECHDGIDNDGNGLTDWPDDPGCYGPFDTEEKSPGECGDGIDNDGDGLTDWPADPGCAWPDSPSESAGKTARLPACADGIDNDHDGKTDYPADPGCASRHDDDETDPNPEPACADGIDNDGDGLTDWPADPGCQAASGDDETDPTEGVCGPGVPVTDITVSGEGMGTVSMRGYSALAPATCDCAKAGSSCGAGAEQVFRFTVKPGTVGDLVATTVDPATTLDTVVYVRGDCRIPATEIACNDDAAPGTKASTAIVHGIRPGTYFIVVDPFAAASVGTFKLRVELMRPLGSPCDLSVSDAGCAPDLVCHPGPGSVRTCERPECSNGKDDDGDGKTDYPDDPGCASPAGDDETDPTPEPQCADGIDNDGDGLTDYPADPDCKAASGQHEAEQCVEGLDVKPLTREMLTQDGIPGSIPYGKPSLAAGSCAWTNVAAEDVYRFDNDRAYAGLVFATGGADFDTAIYVRSPVCGDTTAEVACNSRAPGAYRDAQAIVPSPKAGQTYYVFVDGENDRSNFGSYRLHVWFLLNPGESCDPQSWEYVCGEGYKCAGQGDKTCQPTECNDGIDNDGDGKTDYPNDPGCRSISGDSEIDPVPEPECGNGRDDDNDGKTDYPDDPGCQSASGASELDPCDGNVLPTIPPGGVLGSLSGGVGGGWTGTCAPKDDMGMPLPGADERAFGLEVRRDLKTLTLTTVSQETRVSNLIYLRYGTCDQMRGDSNEIGCNADGAPGSTLDVSPLPRGSYYVVVDGKPPKGAPFPGGWFRLLATGEIAAGNPCTPGDAQFACEPGWTCRGQGEEGVCVLAECHDGIDNDGDGKTDYPADPGCDSPSDDDETDPPTPPICADGKDNDGDGLTDWPADPDCHAASDQSESGDCPDLVPVLYPDAAGHVSGETAGQSWLVPACSDGGDGPEAAVFVRIPGLLAHLGASTVGSAFNTVLTVRRGSCLAGVGCGGPDGEDVANVCCNDDIGWPVYSFSDVELTYRAAGDYYFLVDGYASFDHGAFELQIRGELRPGTACDPAQAGYIACPAGFSCSPGGDGTFACRP